MRLIKLVLDFSVILVIVFAVLFSCSVFSAPEICKTINSPGRYKIKDSGPGKRHRGYLCFVVKDDPSMTGVVTLKNTAGVGDWNILVGEHFNVQEKKVYGTIDYKNNSGPTDELLWLPANSYKEYIVVAFPTTDIPSRGCVIFHRINAMEIAVQAAILATVQSALVELISDENDTRDTMSDKSRVIAGGMSILNRNNLAAVGYDMALNEVGVQLSNAFGGGSWLFTFGMNYFGGYLEQSGKFAFASRDICGE